MRFIIITIIKNIYLIIIELSNYNNKKIIEETC